MLDLAGGTTVYLAWGATDLRKSYNGLAAVIKQDGLTALFIELVNADKTLLEDSYIKKWYRLSC